MANVISTSFAFPVLLSPSEEMPPHLLNQLTESNVMTK
jgi:hypothetical protein